MTAFIADLPFGATLLDPGRTRFRLWAPSCERVSVELADGVALPMRAEAGGWFVAEAACGAGTRYRYRVAEDLAVPDPASRAQDGDVHGCSIVVDPVAYRWRLPDWRGRPWHETVLYELHVGAMGGFRGVAEKLPQLAELGITAIELMPIAEFPGSRNWGYDGTLLFAPECSYGTPEELKALVDRAHELGLSMFLDVVYNHFGPDGNYLHAYAAPFFDPAVHTPWGASIDFERQEVRDFFTQNALYWLNEYRFDGLRFDAVHQIFDQAWLPEMAAAVRAGVEPGRHVHLVLEHDGNAAHLLEAGFDAQWNDDAHHVAHVLLTGETEHYYAAYADAPVQKLARMLAEGFVYQGEPLAHRPHERRGEPSAHLPPTAFVNFLQNHDQIGNRPFGDRLAALADRQALRAAKALFLLAPQIPMLFMGEEGGSQAPFLFFTDHGEALAEAIREGRRREFAGFAAFGDPARHGSIPDPNAAETFEASRALAGEAAELELTRALLGVRKCYTAALPGARSLGVDILGDAAVLARWRLGDGRVLAIAANLGPDPASIAAMQPGEIMFETPSAAAGALATGSVPARATVAWLEPAG